MERRLGKGHGRALALSAVLLVTAFLAVFVGSAHAQTSAGRQWSGKQVMAAFRTAGLPVDNPHQELAMGSPSGPPQGEREAWRFTIPAVAPSGGRIMVFDEPARLNRKLSWFRAMKSNIVVKDNIILWLDSRLSSTLRASYRRALLHIG